MKFQKEFLLCYAVTDRHWLKPGQRLAEAVRQAIEGGASMIQLREKHQSEEELQEEALEVQAVCREYQVPFLINDDVELAVKIDADGVHVGQDDMAAEKARALLGPEKIVGVTAKTAEQAQAAYAAGADYLGSGAVFGTSTKPEAKPMSREQLASICRCVPIPVVAIGGITAENVSELAGTGIAGVAAVGGIFGQPDISAAAKTLRSKMEAQLPK